MNSNYSKFFFISRAKIKFALVSLSIATVLFNSHVVQAAQVLNNTIWYDTDGNPIEARMGTILDNRLNPKAATTWHKRFFWYGTNDKKCSGVKIDEQGNIQPDTVSESVNVIIPPLSIGVDVNPDVYCERHVNAYSSTDLVHWQKADYFKVLEDGNPVSVGGNVLYHPTSGKYFLYASKSNKIYSSDGPVGTFNYLGTLNFGTYTLNSVTKHVQNAALGVYQNPANPEEAYVAVRSYITDTDDKKIYKLRIYKLNSEFDGIVAFNDDTDPPNGGLVWVESIRHVESPSLLIKNVNGVNYYYIFVSETSGWGASKTWYKMAPEGFDQLPHLNQEQYSYDHPNGTNCINKLTNAIEPCTTYWKELKSSTSVKPVKSFMTQHNAVISIPKTDGTEQFMYMGERWSDAIYDPDYMCVVGNPDCKYWTDYTSSYIGTYLTDDGFNPTNLDSHYHWAPVTFDSQGVPRVSPVMNWSNGL